MQIRHKTNLFMKKCISLLFLLSFLSSAMAQLSGTYTIGGKSADYSTFNDAAADLKGKGVSGPVVMKVRTGVYNEQVIIGSINGVSSTNTITFRPDTIGVSNPLIVYAPTGSSDNYTVSVDNGKHLIFSYLKLQTGGTIYSTVLKLVHTCDSNTFDHCTFTGGITTNLSTSSSTIYNTNGNSNPVTNTTFQDCDIWYGVYGIYWHGGTASTAYEKGNRFIGNRIMDFYYVGFAAYYQEDFVAYNNLMYDSSTSQTSYGFRHFYSIGRSEIHDNQIVSNAQVSTIMLDLFNVENFDSTNPSRIYNNQISQVNPYTYKNAYGLSSNNCRNMVIAYNSILILGGSNGRGMTFNADTTGTYGNVDVLNNNIVNYGPGFAHGVGTGAVSIGYIRKMDHNNLYSSGIVFSSHGNTDCLTFEDWKKTSGFDSSSVNVDPGYTSVYDLHISELALNRAAVPVSFVKYDLDGETRDSQYPDIGVDEIFPPKNDIAVVDINTSRIPGCADDSSEVIVTVRNLGENTQSKFDITLEIMGIDTSTKTFSGTLKSNESNQIIFSGVNTLPGGKLDIIAWTDLSGDLNNGNDTLSKVTYVSRIPSDPVPVHDTVCTNGLGILSAMHDPGITLSWFASPTSGKSLSEGDNFFVSKMKRDTTFWVSGHSDPASDSLEAGTTSGTGCKGGIMFELKSDKTIVLTDFSTFFPNTGNNPVSIYYRRGSISGVRTDPSQWNFLDTGNISVSNGTVEMKLGFNLDITLEADSIYGFYITGNVGYAGGTSTFSNGLLTLSSTTGLCSYFGDTIPNQKFSGKVYYKRGLQCESGRIPVHVHVFTPMYPDLGMDTGYCAGETFSLTLDAGGSFVSYLWDDGSSKRYRQVNQKGLYEVQVQDVNGCYALDDVTISEYTAPMVNIGNDTFACTGTFIGFDMFAPPGYTYLWSDGSKAQATHANGIGVYSVTVTDSHGCATVDSLVINPLPGVTLNLGPDISYCSGKTPNIVLHAGGGHAYYYWNNGQTDSTLRIFTKGVYSVEVENSNGCKGMDSVEIIELPLPDVDLGDDYGYCMRNGLHNVLDAGVGYDTYLWNDGSGQQTITVNSEGEYRVVVTDTNGCLNSDTITITEYQDPVVNLGSDLILNPASAISETLDAGSGFAGYKWNDGTMSSSLHVVSEGEYSVIVTDDNGCTASDTVVVRYWKTTGMAVSGTSGVSIYPNPSRGMLNFYNETGDRLFVELIGIDGRVLKSFMLFGRENQIDLDDCASGIYTMRISGDQSSSTLRIALNRD